MKRVINSQTPQEDEMEDRKKRLRSDRFKDHLSLSVSTVPDLRSSDNLTSPKRVKGLSNKLERPYLRLTSAPNPSMIRPLNILKLALENVKQKYVQTEDYDFACEQLKSIRQDLTVQNINNRFTAHVYETHGRIALESGDLSEYNQCQSRLQEMRRRGVQISADEFDCYRLLHSLYRENKLELISTLRSLARSHALDNDMVKFALRVHTFLLDGNYAKFFQLYNVSPHLSGYILDYMLLQVRNSLYNRIVRSHDSLPIAAVQKQLNFSSSSECVEYVLSRNGVLTSPGGGSGPYVNATTTLSEVREYVLDCKLSRARE